MGGSNLIPVSLDWLPSPAVEGEIVATLREAQVPLATAEIALIMGRKDRPVPVACGVGRLLERDVIEVADSREMRGVEVRRFRLTDEGSYGEAPGPAPEAAALYRDRQLARAPFA